MHTFRGHFSSTFCDPTHFLVRSLSSGFGVLAVAVAVPISRYLVVDKFSRFSDPYSAGQTKAKSKT